jgi:hypothetical protein
MLVQHQEQSMYHFVLLKLQNLLYLRSTDEIISDEEAILQDSNQHLCPIAIYCFIVP